MTREEIKKAMNDTKKEVVLKNLHKLLSLVEGYPEYEDCVEYAIEKLEQEPIIDKMRAEISKSKTEHEMEIAEKDEKARLLISHIYCDIVNILDKYKAESERT